MTICHNHANNQQNDQFKYDDCSFFWVEDFFNPKKELPLHIESSVPALSLASLLMREESPGSIGRSTSENRSYW